MLVYDLLLIVGVICRKKHKRIVEKFRLICNSLKYEFDTITLVFLILNKLINYM